MEKLNNQIQIPHNEKMNIIHKCEICDKEYKTRNGLRLHFVKFHDEQKGQQQCNVCNIKFSCQSKLNSHMKSVHEDKNHHKCNECGKSFTRESNMKTHI